MSGITTIFVDHQAMGRRSTKRYTVQHSGSSSRFQNLTLNLFFITITHSCCIIKPLSALRRLRASNQVEEDIEEMRAEERAQSSESSISIMELICSPTLRAPLIIGIVMQLSQQLSGINAVSLPFQAFSDRFPCFWSFFGCGTLVSSRSEEVSSKFKCFKTFAAFRVLL